MKLIDLLVQELPKRGGWPDGKGGITCNSISGAVYAHGEFLFVTNEMLEFQEDAIEKHQYEAALIASKQVAWTGEGLPPVGCECESLHCFTGSEWRRIVIKWSDESQFLYEWLRGGHPVHHLLGYVDQYRFRPIRTEAERKRDEALVSLVKVVGGHMTTKDADMAKAIYDAISAGKIPHITLK